MSRLGRLARSRRAAVSVPEVLEELVFVGEALQRTVGDLGPGSHDRRSDGLVTHFGPPRVEQRRGAGTRLRHDQQSRSAAGDEGDDDVRRVLVEALAAVIFGRGGAGVSVPGAICTSRSGTPASRAHMMKAAQHVGCTAPMPARLAIERIQPWAVRRSRRLPSWRSRIGPDVRSPMARSMVRAVRGASGMTAGLLPLPIGLDGLSSSRCRPSGWWSRLKSRRRFETYVSSTPLANGSSFEHTSPMTRTALFWPSGRTTWKSCSATSPRRPTTRRTVAARSGSTKPLNAPGGRRSALKPTAPGAMSRRRRSGTRCW